MSKTDFYLTIRVRVKHSNGAKLDPDEVASYVLNDSDINGMDIYPQGENRDEESTYELDVVAVEVD